MGKDINISIELKDIATIAAFKALNDVSAENVKKITSKDFKESNNEAINNFTEAYSLAFKNEFAKAYKGELQKLIDIATSQYS